MSSVGLRRPRVSLHVWSMPGEDRKTTETKYSTVSVTSWSSPRTNHTIDSWIAVTINKIFYCLLFHSVCEGGFLNIEMILSRDGAITSSLTWFFINYWPGGRFSSLREWNAFERLSPIAFSFLQFTTITPFNAAGHLSTHRPEHAMHAKSPFGG